MRLIVIVVFMITNVTVSVKVESSSNLISYNVYLNI